MECQDCNKKEVDSLIFDTQKNEFFLVCRDCITNIDYLCPEGIINKIKEEL